MGRESGDREHLRTVRHCSDAPMHHGERVQVYSNTRSATTQPPRRQYVSDAEIAP